MTSFIYQVDEFHVGKLMKNQRSTGVDAMCLKGLFRIDIFVRKTMDYPHFPVLFGGDNDETTPFLQQPLSPPGDDATKRWRQR